MNIECLIDHIKKYAASSLRVKSIPQNVLNDIRIAIEHDEKLIGRYPTCNECELMMQGDDEDEDVVNEVTQFSKTLEELESLWQLR